MIDIKEVLQAAKEAGEEAAKEAAKAAAEEAAKEAAMDNARKFFENGVSYDIVRASITTISDEELQKIYEQVTGNSN